MAKIFEKKWFLGALIGGSCFISLSVVSGFVVKAYLEKKRREEIIATRQEADRKYEEQFRTSMRRVLENLKLDHFLAAYKNLETLPEPKRADALKVEEYLEVLNRVGSGLIQNQLLREAENVFLTIRNFEGQVTYANEALGKIESKRRVENAKFFLLQGEQLLNQKRHREANREFEKVQLELRSAEILQYDNVSDIWEKLRPKLREARFYTLMEDADGILKKAETLLREGQFKQTDQAISQAAIKVGRAAYFKPGVSEVAALRARISSLDAELGYAIPNAIPIWNRYISDDQQKHPNYFSLAGYELTPSLNKENQIKLGLQYFMTPESHYFVVRYRVFFYNGRNIFNGHYLMTEGSDRSSLDKVRSIVYMQEVPEDLRNAQIKRIEVKVYDENNQIVSRVTRAFRGQGT